MALKLVRLCIVVVGSILLACVYGILHDLVTAHVCVEYFSVAHPMVIEAVYSDPIACALIWGILATWWFGALFGLALAIVLMVRHRGVFSMFPLCKSILKLLLVNGSLAFLAGCFGYLLGKAGLLRIPEHLRYPFTGEPLSPSLAGPFFFDVFAHASSYIVGALLSILFLRNMWRGSASFPPHTGPA